MDDQALRRLFNVNVFGAIAAMQAVIPAMRRRQGGVIANISGVCRAHAGAVHGHGWLIVGLCGKQICAAGLQRLPRMELATEKIHVLTVLPGRTVSKLTTIFW